MKERLPAEPAVEIRVDDLTDPRVVALLKTHLEEAAAHSPPGTGHALDPGALCGPDITFWTLWLEGEVVGCGALREIDPRHGEIKSMHTIEAYRGRGLARRMVRHLLDEARRRAYRHVSLETGATPGFAAARALYARMGFRSSGPFGAYRDDSASVYMTVAITIER